MRSAPKAADLLGNAVVKDALDDAWADSLPANSTRRHEEGGWIYMNVVTGDISVRRAASGGQAAIDLSDPEIFAGLVVVGKFHTHPNPTAEGWDPGPSEVDLVVDARHGVPDLIRADDGVYISGPDNRIGGLDGGQGYPPVANLEE